MAGVDVQELEASSLLSVVYSLIVDEQLGPQVETTRHEARLKVDEWIEEGTATIDHKPPPKFDPETWGLMPEHEAGQSVALQMVGSLSTGGDGQ